MSSSKKLKLYTSPPAFPNPQRVRLLLHEKGQGDAVEEIILDMSPVGEQRQWRHIKRNPWGETPALELDDGTFLSESVAIARYFDQTLPGRKVMGESPKEVAEDTMWNDRIWTRILYNIVTTFHVLHEGLGPKLELTHNPQWGEHSRKQAIAHAALVNTHLADGREWLLGGKEPTFSDITMCVAIAFGKFGPLETPLDEKFEHIDAYWQRWKARPSFQAAYKGGAGLEELKHLK